MAFINIYFQAPTFIPRIEKEKTKEWPNGLVWKVAKMVEKLYPLKKQDLLLCPEKEASRAYIARRTRPIRFCCCNCLTRN